MAAEDRPLESSQLGSYITLIRQVVHTADPETLSRWRSLDPVLLLVALALSASGSLAVYVAAAYVTNKAKGSVVGTSPCTSLTRPAREGPRRRAEQNSPDQEPWLVEEQYVAVHERQLLHAQAQP